MRFSDPVHLTVHPGQVEGTNTPGVGLVEVLESFWKQLFHHGGQGLSAEYYEEEEMYTNKHLLLLTLFSEDL